MRFTDNQIDLSSLAVAENSETSSDLLFQVICRSISSAEVCIQILFSFLANLSRPVPIYINAGIQSLQICYRDTEQSLLATVIHITIGLIFKSCGFPLMSLSRPMFRVLIEVSEEISCRTS